MFRKLKLNVSLHKNILAAAALTALTFRFSGFLSPSDSWFFFYACEWAAVIFAAAASNFLGFAGFFTVTVFFGLALAASLLTSFNSFFVGSGATYAHLGEAHSFLGFSGGLSFYVDFVGYSFGLLTALIGAAVYLYAFSYMRFEKNILNFLVYLEVFKLSMIMLVWANSWPTLILG